MLRAGIALLLPVFIGAPVVAALGSPKKWTEGLGEAFLIGVVSEVFVVTVLGIAGVTLGMGQLVAAMAVWMAITGVAATRGLRRPLAVRIRLPPMSTVGWAFIGLTGLNILATTAHAVLTPVGAYDALVIWLPKADVLLRLHHFLALRQTVFPDYPPAWPVHMFIAQITAPGFPVKVLPDAYLVSMLLVVFAYIEARVGPTAAAMTIWFISGIPYLWFGYGLFDLMADVPFMAFAVASTVALGRYAERREVADLLASLLLAIGAALTRPEGVIHLFLVAAILALLAWKSQRSGLAGGVLVVAALTFASWQYVIRAVLHHPPVLTPDLRRIGAVITFDNAYTLLRYSLHEFSNPYIFGPTLIAVLVIIAGWRSWRTMLPLLVIFLLDVLAISLVYLILPSTNDQPLRWWLVTGTKRMLLHFSPLLFVAATIAACEPVRLLWNARNDTVDRIVRFGATPTLIPTRKGRRLLAILVIVIPLTCLVTWRVAGPRDLALPNIAPSGLASLSLPIVSGTDLITETPGLDYEGAIYYDLQSLASNERFSDSVFGRFTSLAANLNASPAGSDYSLEIATDGRVLARNSTQRPSSDRTNVHLQPGARTLELIVLPNGERSPTRVVWHEVILHRDGSWLVITLLLLGGAGIAVVVLTASRRKAMTGIAAIGPSLLPALFLIAAIVQQIDVLTNVLLPLLDARIVYRLPSLVQAIHWASH